jgi:hypothetical protein
LVYYCQASNITIDPTIAVHEKINYNKQMVHEVSEELKLFYKINDSDNIESLKNYSLGKAEGFKIKENNNKDMESYLIDWYNQYNRLIGWDSAYLYTLASVFYYNGPQSREKKFENFISWMRDEFMYSATSIYFARVLFAAYQEQGIMKYKNESSAAERKKALNNMTWDLYFMKHWLKLLKEKSEKTEIMAATADRSVKRILKMLKNDHVLEPFKKTDEKNHKSDLGLMERYEKIVRSEGPRKFQNDAFEDPDHRKKLIEEFEKRLLSE